MIAQKSDIVKRTLSIMIPVILQNILIYSLNMIDSIMLSSYGQSEFAASSLANQAWFIYTLFAFGLSTGTCILTAQYFGRKDKISITSVMFIGFSLSVIVSAAFAVLLFVNPGFILKIYTNDENLIALGSAYLKVIAPGYLLTSFSLLYAAYLKSVGKAVAPLLFNALSIAVNAVLNYMLIFGAWGAPRLGIRGAALATLIARAVEFGLMLIYFKRYEEFLSLNVNLSRAKQLLGDFFRYSAPVLLNETLWGLGISMQAVVFGRMGESVISAFSVNSTIEKIATIACMGLTQSAAVILGAEMGRGRLKEANRYAKAYLLLSGGFGFLCGFGVLFSYPLVAAVFKLPPETAVIYKGFSTVMALFLTIKGFNLVGVCSILRSGGDSRAALCIDVGVMWLGAIPLAWYLSSHYALAPHWIYAAFICDEFLKFPILMLRIRQKKWLRNITSSVLS